MKTEAITGNTYPVRSALADLGGVWNGFRQAWLVPADKAGEARALVAAVPAKAQLEGRGYQFRTVRKGGRKPK